MKSSYSFILGHTCAIADLDQMRHHDDATAQGDWWYMSRINVPWKWRGQGFGSAVLRMVLKDADEDRATIWLLPFATGENMRGLDQSALVAWYGRHGFVWERHGDRSYMVRHPLETASVVE